MKYNEHSIKRLTEEEITERIMFQRIQELAEEYDTDASWLQRVFEAAYMVNIDEQYVIDKYLKKMDLAVIPELQEAHREITRATFMCK